MHMKRVLTGLAAGLLVAAALPLHAQSGCTDSPEDPTLVLALLAGLGVFAVSARGFFNRKQ